MTNARCESTQAWIRTLLLAVFCAAPQIALGQPYAIDEFPIPLGGVSGYLAADDDGSVWYTVSFPRRAIGHVSPLGHITEYPIPTTAENLSGIVIGPDKNVWFGEWSNPGGQAPLSRIGRISRSGGNFQEFTVPESPHGEFYFANPRTLIVGPDGNMWFTAGSDALGRIDTAGEVTMFYLPEIGCSSLPFYSEPYDVTVGPDGALWLSVTVGTGPVRFDLDTHEFQALSIWPCGTTSTGITNGPDENLWLTDFHQGHLFRVTPSGGLTTFDFPGAPYWIVSVGNELVVSRFGINLISRVDPATGTVLEDLPIPAPNNNPSYMVADAAGNIWFSQQYGGHIGRLSRHPLPCIDAVALTYQNQTLTIRFGLKTQSPAFWSTVLFVDHAVIPLWFLPVPAVSPEVMFDVPLPGFPPAGPVVVVTALLNANLQVCGDLQVIDTGPPK